MISLPNQQLLIQVYYVISDVIQQQILIMFG